MIRRMLDVCCCEGVGAWGYWRSGRFHEITGVDIDHEALTRYSFDKHQASFLSLDYEQLAGYSFIHVSPPCQAYSKMTPKAARAGHMRLIAAAHLMCQASGLPYVIENVEGSSCELRPNLVIDGQCLGLKIKRRRYFYVSTLKEPIRMISSAAASHLHGAGLTRAETAEAMGLPDYIPPRQLARITQHGMEQGIPPVITEFIAALVFPDKAMIGENEKPGSSTDSLSLSLLDRFSTSHTNRHENRG